jgi:hypothetical protein
MDAPRKFRSVVVAICSLATLNIWVASAAAHSGHLHLGPFADASTPPGDTGGAATIHGDGPAGPVADPVADPEALSRYLASDRSATPGGTPGRLAAGTRSVTVKLIPVRFQGDPRLPLDPTTAMGRLITDSNSVRNYYLEQSNGRVSINAQLIPTVTIPFGDPDCNVDEWTASADAAAAVGTLPPGTVKVYYWPEVTQCPWLGLAELDGTHAWINDDFERTTVTHEIGHLLGAGHARSRSCFSGATPTTLSTTCTQNEYGDPFNVMGGGPTGSLNHMSASHKLDIGAFDVADFQEATVTGRFTIAPLEAAPSPTPRSLVIARTPNDAFFIESRRALSTQFDAFGPSDPVTNGVLVHLVDNGDVFTDLLDLHPATPTLSDAPLLVGEAFSDPSSGVSIELVSVSDAGAVLDVSIVDSLAPTAPTPLSGYSFSTKDIRLIWNASTDNRSTPRYHIERDGVIVATTTQPFFFDGGLEAASTHRYRVVAVDGAGNLSLPSNTVDVSTQAASVPLVTAPPPTTDPSQIPTRDGKGSLVGTRVTLGLTAIKRPHGRYTVRAAARASDDCRYRFASRPWRPCDFGKTGRFTFAVVASRRRPVTVSVEAASLSGTRVVRTLKVGRK